MESSIKRVLKSRQIGLVQTNHLISGTAGTPADSGTDSMYVESVVDNAVGSWTITFKGVSLRDVAVVGLASVTASRILSVSAVSTSSVTVIAKDEAGVDADADFYVSCLHATTVEAKF